MKKELVNDLDSFKQYCQNIGIDIELAVFETYPMWTSHREYFGCKIPCVDKINDHFAQYFDWRQSYGPHQMAYYFFPKFNS